MNFKVGVVAAVAAAAASLAGCAAPGPGDPGSEERVASLPTSTPSATATELAPLGTPDAAPKTMRPVEPTELAVTGVRVGSHKAFDRVVVDLAGTGTPGWYVDYVPSPMEEATGRPLNVVGSAFLNIYIDGTIYPFELGLGPVPVDTSGGSTNIVDVLNVGTSEGRSQVVVGLRSEKPFSVQVLDNPTRLVVDILKS
ncbi:hypothetical protein [Corynebacterium timonense]|nr:hypothetical protein [Corynebacterium timonense]